jgi:hypothetical protein
VITVEQEGRLGNALFQWAFAYAASRRLGTTFWLDERRVRSVFRLDPAPAATLRGLRVRVAWRTGGLAVRDVSGEENPDTVLAGLTDRTHYRGFFQSARYFAGYEQEIRRLLGFRSRYRRAFQVAHGDLAGHVAVHVRRGDYAEYRGGTTLPDAWYRECLARIDAVGRRPVCFVSDDLPYVCDRFADVPGARFVAASEAVDLQVLARADALVLSPSSFSWWGAWLNERSPQVLVPQGWIDFRGEPPAEYPSGVICPEWERVPVAVNPARGAS